MGETRMHFDNFPSVLSESTTALRAGRCYRPRRNPQTQEDAFQEFRDEFGHTSLSIEEKIPWKCHRLVIGTGAYCRLPVMKEVKLEVERRHLELVVVPTGLEWVSSSAIPW
jgi:hypothetical protein